MQAERHYSKTSGHHAASSGNARGLSDYSQYMMLSQILNGWTLEV